MSKLSLLLLACLAAFAAAQVTVTIPGIVNPDVGAALSNAQKSGKVASAPGAKQGSAQAPSAAMSQGQSGQQQGQMQGGGQQGGQSGIASQLQQAGVGGRHLLQGAQCFFSGQVGGTGIFVSNFDLCPFTPGAQPNSQCCAKGATFFGKCIPSSLSCVCGL